MFDAEKLRALNFAMIDYYTGMPKYIQHFEKVHAFSSMIAQEEGLDEDTRFILEAAALVHDIGIKPAEKKYGSAAGKFQELEGPAEARRLLAGTEMRPEAVERVCLLVSRHHTYTDVLGIDHRILLEADFLVNCFEDNVRPDAARAFREQVFRTKTGTQLLTTMFSL